ncbi:2OG-Fe(II) oxygenase [Prochlorothrix hollandica]|uniref:2OG-Fe(II) oxygenase n=1 Tax=Prochlorothrix hollandica TaxID=1223 RepID=UPI0003460EA1|nr:2OG-Fe(II) oxygenase [Prochlorothrix hollandica]
MINYNLLESQLLTYSDLFKNAKPFPHLIMDNFLDLEVAYKAYNFFPKMSEMDILKDIRQYKAQDPDLSKFDPIFSQIIFEHLHSDKLVHFLEKVTGIKCLLPDSQLYASGLAQATNGSFLNVHIDNSSHPVQPWYRRLNLLIYLNPNWTEEKGGHLELWSKKMEESVAILPVFNRAVIFATDSKSLHGHRTVNTIDGDTRKSINIYYFTQQSPTGQEYYHVTSFRARNKEILNKLVYPMDNFLRSTLRKLRPQKDSHAVLFDKDQDQ